MPNNAITWTVPPEHVVNGMGALVSPYTCGIVFVPHGDEREPPGNHEGTGSLFDLGVPTLVTCEHVVQGQNQGVIAYNRYGAEFGTSVGTRFQVHNVEDIAKASLKKSWDKVAHEARLLSLNSLASTHAPVAGEYLYVQGFPAYESHAAFETHQNQAVELFLHEVDFPEGLQNEDPRASPLRHITLASNPANAKSLNAQASDILLLGGMSGSLLWNTRYVEVTAGGRAWTAAEARISGIVWGESSKYCVLVATPIQHWRSFLC